MKNLYYLLPVLLLLGCSGDSKSVNHKQIVENLQFDFQARKNSETADLILVDVQLKNHRKDTLYLFTYTCGNWFGFPTYDKGILNDAIHIYCNQTIPRIAKIAPKETVKTTFRYNASPAVDEFSFGFVCYPVEKDFDLSPENTRHYEKTGKKIEFQPVKVEIQ